MPIEGKKTVWILGAGFSRSLGGPLLSSLFRQEDVDDFLDVIPTADFGTLAAEVVWTQSLYNKGHDGEKCWENAEDFLAYIESAFGDPADHLKRAKVNGVIKRAGLASSPDPRPTVTRALAFECSRFLFESVAPCARVVVASR